MSGKAMGSRACSGNRLVASLVWDICYPLKHDFMGWSVMLFPGDHYIVPKDKMQEMHIPEYDDTIPHYLIYDRQGKLVKAIIGWPGVEDMMIELAKVK